MKDKIDHDGLFKKLLTLFFFEFLLLFLPAVVEYIDPDFVEFLDKETFGGTRSRRRRESDLVVKVRFRNRKEAFFIIHVENESSIRPDFPERMFRYFLRLTEKYNAPVYPVVIFSHDTPTKPAPAYYEIAFPDKTVLQFHYTVIQLNRLPWRRFVKQANPVAAALMTKMQIPAKDRPKVKAQCLRLLATLKLSPEKAELIYVFIESYITLTAKQTETFEREWAKFDPQVKDTTMEIISSARREGRLEGKEELLTLQLQRRFSTLPETTTLKLDKLTSEQFDELGVELWNFQTLAELDDWLARR
ncbi:MAG: Rpn family recombination-promoting nuclease/putative transposase [Capsulimonadaceae bacterium]